jgi:hypothetical protein
MREGYIVWNGNAQRPDIRYGDGTCYGGLHCGNTLEAFVQGRWQPARIEYRHSADLWYLDGVENGGGILWMTVRN